MKILRSMAAVSLLLVLASCSSWKEAKAKRAERESYQNPFYMKYLEEGSALDREIMARIEALRENPDSPPLHNELGALLFERKFPKDARYEFERALKLDKRFYPARYNLAILELSQGNQGSAERQLRKLLRSKPGHPEAHFTLGLIYEKRGRQSAAIDHYGKAFTINPELLQVKKNPRIVESELVTATLLALYEDSRERAAAVFMPAPAGYVPPEPKKKPAADVPQEPPAAEENAAPVTGPVPSEAAPPPGR